MGILLFNTINKHCFIGIDINLIIQYNGYITYNSKLKKTMPRPIKWVDDGFKAIKVKTDTNTFERYKRFVRKEKTSFQDDLEKHIKEVISK